MKPSKQRYGVILPIVGEAYTEVEAESEEAAIEAAFEVDPTDESLATVEWQTVRRITTGNVLHASTNEASARPLTNPESEGGNG